MDCIAHENTVVQCNSECIAKRAGDKKRNGENKKTRAKPVRDKPLSGFKSGAYIMARRPSAPLSLGSCFRTSLVLRCSAVHYIKKVQSRALHMKRMQYNASRECSAHGESAMQCSAHWKLLRCTTKRAGDKKQKQQCNAVYRQSALHIKTLHCSAPRKFLRCIAKCVGNEEGEWRKR